MSSAIEIEPGGKTNKTAADESADHEPVTFKAGERAPRRGRWDAQEARQFARLYSSAAKA